jgi:hypothetical protein
MRLRPLGVPTFGKTSRLATDTDDGPLLKDIMIRYSFLVMFIAQAA